MGNLCLIVPTGMLIWFYFVIRGWRKEANCHYRKGLPCMCHKCIDPNDIATSMDLQQKEEVR